MEAENWTGFGVVYVTPNLCAALRHIRKPDEEIFLWADAICINQRSTTERGHQVKQMADIYGNATEVLAWLGPDPWNRARRAFSLLRLTEYRDRDKLMKEFKDLKTSDDYLSAWSWVTNQAWFKRIWTTQELGLSSDATMICGNSRISWLAFYEVHRILNDSFDSEVLRLWKVQHGLIAFLYQWKTSHNVSFLQTVAYTQHRETSDARDRIFALLTHPSVAAARDHYTFSRVVLDADYKKSTAEVYTEATISMIRQLGTLDALSFVRSLSSGCVGLPSWAPDWSTRQATYPMLTTQGMACGTSDGPMNNTLPLFSVPGQLKTSGISCGKVTWHCQASQIQTKSGMDVLIEPNATSQTDPTLRHVEKNVQHTRSQDIPGHLCRLGAMMRVDVDWQPYALPGPQTMALKELPASESTIRLLEELCVGRRMFRTDTGLMGLGPEQLQENDEVVVLNSGRVPFLLRPAHDSMHTFVGECCGDGLMTGEAVSDPDSVIRGFILI